MSDMEELALEFGRKHPFRMALWWMAEAAVSLLLGIQSDMEDKNRKVLVPVKAGQRAEPRTT